MSIAQEKMTNDPVNKLCKFKRINDAHVRVKHQFNAKIFQKSNLKPEMHCLDAKWQSPILTIKAQTTTNLQQNF